jgi:3-phosphoshikimate 1-carboxyvinyltransferase
VQKFWSEIEEIDSAIIVKPIKVMKLCLKSTKNSGTTIRIASGIASTFTKEITLTGDSSLQKRPMKPLLDALESMGAKCSSTNGMPPIKITGRILGGDVSIPGNFSSQFISALLICAPLTKKSI